MLLDNCFFKRVPNLARALRARACGVDALVYVSRAGVGVPLCAVFLFLACANMWASLLPVCKTFAALVFIFINIFHMRSY